jgi:phosphatidylglycerophosphate synthase
MTVTYFTLLLAVFALLFLTLQSQIMYGVFVFLVGFFDGVDGAVARLSNKSSTIGGFMDSLIDKVAETILLVAILVAYPDDMLFEIPLSWFVIICLSSWLLTSYVRSRAECLGVNDLDIGLGARSERLFILCIFSILSLLYLGLLVVTIIGVSTVAFRVYHYSRQIRSNGDIVSDQHV